MLSELLLTVKPLLEHASPDQLCDLIDKCGGIALLWRGFRLGTVSSADFQSVAGLLMASVNSIMNSVSEAVDTGRLSVQDGRIVGDPLYDGLFDDDDVDDWDEDDEETDE